ncbi:hypothetical protein [Streptomyces palmae]|uniref:Lipoprotein n=1 Tax=Streptomyces palmae TaxID=1701085 RepID=A0A4Z0G9Q1_9ACTN|nr:hypothetical protein [Streptomyces palmae]TGA90913.1 hypothetical protein E4099_28560 [Streptomyces palmae]
MRLLRHLGRGRVLPAAAAVSVVFAAATACEPQDEQGLTAVSAAYTTDEVATKALERGGIDVRWLSCTGNAKGDEVAGSSRKPIRAVDVDCRGTAEKHDAEIRVTGVVTYQRKGRCVRGDLTAKVAGRKAFHASLIGDCGPTSRPS